MKTLVLFAALLTMAALPAPAYAQAQAIDVNVTVVGHVGAVTGSTADHVLSFSGPIAIPGVGLAPGAYVFRLLTPSVVQVWNEDRSMIYATFFVNPAWRAEGTKDYSVSLKKIRDDAPPRLTTLFPPNQLSGYEILYPKTEIAYIPPAN